MIIRRRCLPTRGLIAGALLFALYLVGIPSSVFGGDVIKIGVLGALSGPKSPYGQSQLSGATLAIEEINRADSSRQLELLPVDDKGDMSITGELVRDLIYRDKVVFILGSIDSGCSHVVSMICTKVQVPHVTCVSTDPSLTRGGTPWTFRTLADDERQSEALIQYLTQNPGLRSLGLMAVDSRYGKMGVRTLQKRGKAMGLNVNGPYWIKSNNQGLEEAVTGILSQPCEAVLIWSLSEVGKQAVGLLRSRGYKGLILGGDGLATPAFYEANPEITDGVVVTCPYDPSFSTPENDDFKARFQRKYGRMPDSFAAHAYDTIKMVTAALIKSDGTRKGLRDSLAAPHQFSGATGIISLDQSGNDTRSVYLAVCTGGKLRLMERMP